MAIADVRNGVIPQFPCIDVRLLGGFEYPLGKGGAEQRLHDGIGPLAPQLIPGVIKRLDDYLGVVRFEAGF